MAQDRDSNNFPIPFRSAPFNTYHIVDADDFKTTNLSSYPRHNAHAIERAVYYASRERRSNQALTCKLDAPYRLWLTEKESRKKDYIKFKFEKRGLQRPTSHLVTKKEIQEHHKHREIDDYHLSRQVELCEATLHPEHNVHNLFPHQEIYHNPAAAALDDALHLNLLASKGIGAATNSISLAASSPTLPKHISIPASSPSKKSSLSSPISPVMKPKGKQPKWSPSKAAIDAMAAAEAKRAAGSNSTSKLPTVRSPGDKAPIEGKKSLW